MPATAIDGVPAPRHEFVMAADGITPQTLAFDGERLSYRLGHDPPGQEIEISVDALVGFVAGLVALLGLGLAMAAWHGWALS